MQIQLAVHSSRIMPRSIGAFASLTLALAVSASVVAQTAPASGSAPGQNTTTRNDNGEEVVVLSPFEVHPGEDNGYLASSALSGTRLRTDLKDIAASVSVVTKDFMRDVNAKDLTSLLVYTLGTEVAGPGGNFSGATVQPTFVDFETQLGNASPNTRVRGLINADTARDFFITKVPLDTYNIERVEINRGANSLLFGLGSPGGIINYSLIKADARRTHTALEYQVGSESSNRVSLDHNQVLIKDKLALRLASFYDDIGYRSKPAFDRRKALYLTTTYRPFKNTTIRLTAEAGESNSNKPWGRTPFDGISMWWDLGKPVYNVVTDQLSFLGTPKAPFTTATPFTNPATNTRNTSVITATGMGSNTNMMTLVYSDPATSQLGIGSLPYVGFKEFADRSALNPNGTLRSAGFQGLAGGERFLNNVVYGKTITKGFWRIPMLSDPRLFDFYHNQADGDNKHEWAKWRTYNATVEQSFLDGRAGIELAVNREKIDTASIVPLTFNQYQLKIDINLNLPDGSPNPNFGKVMMGGTGFIYRYHTDSDVGRATGYYKLDLRRTGPDWLGKILGTHLFTVAFTEQKDKNEIKQGYPFNTDVAYSVDNFGLVNSVDTTGRIVSLFHYMSGDVSGTNSVQDVSVQRITGAQWPVDLHSAKILTNIPVPAGSAAPSPWTQKSYGLQSIGPEDDVNKVLIGPWVELKGQKIQSGVATAQSHWLEDTLVSTIGWRRDRVDSYTEGSAPVDPATGLGYVVYKETFVSRMEEDSWSGGVALHAPKFVTKHLPWDSGFSLLYSQSKNFKVTNQRFNVFGDPIGPETGRTKEYGVRFSALGGKIDFKIGRYETSADDSSSTVNLSTPISQLVAQVRAVETANRNGANSANTAGLSAWETWKASAGAQQFFKTFRFDFTPATPTANARTLEVLPTTDTVSKGWDYELVANPTTNWRISLNAAKAEAVRDHTGEDLRQLMSTVFAPMLAGDAGTLLTGAQQGTLRDAIQIAVTYPVNAVVLQDGSPTSELRRWRFNAVTSYDLPWAFAKGWTVTGAYRWQDRAAIGFPVATTGGNIAVPDVKHPFWAPREDFFDASISYHRKLTQKIDWRVSLFLRNIGVGNELRPVHAQPDGSIDAWQIKEPMRWTLTNTFTF